MIYFDIFVWGLRIKKNIFVLRKYSDFLEIWGKEKKCNLMILKMCWLIIEVLLFFKY